MRPEAEASGYLIVAAIEENNNKNAHAKGAKF